MKKVQILFVGVLVVFIVLFMHYYFQTDKDNSESSDQVETVTAIQPQFFYLNGDGEWETVKTGTEQKTDWFVDKVLFDAATDLSAHMDISIEDAQVLLNTGGYRLYTTLSPAVQSIAETIYENADSIDTLLNHDPNIQSGITIIEPHTGYIVATVGAFGREGLANNARERRTAGSILNPLISYAPSIERGLVAPNTVFSIKTINGLQKDVSVNVGLKMSINEVSSEILNALGVKESCEFAARYMGLPLDVTESNCVSLEGDEMSFSVSTEDLAAAYAVFANGGIYNKPRSYLWIENMGGEIVFENPENTQRAVSESTALVMTEMLQMAVKSGTGIAARFDDMSIAGSVGSTEKNYDRWFVGYTPYYVAAVWAGNEDDVEITSDSNPACLIWKTVMQEIHKELPTKAFVESIDDFE